MSLTTRLRLFIIALMVSVISALSALYLYSLGGATFDDILRRAQVDAQQVKNFMDQRLREKMAQMPPPADIEETKRLWTELISTDAEFAQFLENWTANTQVIIEILVADANGRILADSIPSRVGHRVYPLPDFTEWVKKSLWARLIEIFSQMRDYEVTLPLGVAADNNQPVFTIKVVLSSVFLRGAVYPYIRSIALIFLGALLLSMLLAVVVSNLALRPLAGISKTIDRISRGEFAKHPLASESKEY
ncbi:MAG TPA: hypothetical protein PLP04_10570, partial [Bryobacteraceae bacterium]|nr:hypothetical protein [Bryobacteraceae bacterium]